MAMKIGELLVSKGVLTESQVGEILLKQRQGDTRKFGDIAVDLKFMEDTALNRYLDMLAGQK